MAINIMHQETQRSITNWANETFGAPSNVMVIYDRMMDELTELRWELLKNVGEADNTRAVGREVADVAIMLAQIAELSRVNLHTEVDDKMAINRKREWVTTGEGVGKHV